MPALRDPRLSHGIAVLGLSGLVLLSWWRYHPTNRQVSRLNARLAELRDQAEQIEQRVSLAGGLESWTQQQEHTLQAVKQRFPPSSQVPQLLDALLERVQRANLTLVDVRQGNPEPARDAQGEPLTLEGVPSFHLPVTLQVGGTFRSIQACLKQLVSDEFPCLVTVAGMQMTLKDPKTAQLNATMELVLHMAGS